MGRVATRSRLPPAEYLAWEREQVDKHEYHAGDVFAMAGGSPRHNWIAGNVQSILKRSLDARCFTFLSDQRIVFDDGRRYVYPDVSVVCGPIVLQDRTNDVVVNPSVLVEVLSSTTEQYDRGLKWEGYQCLPSVTDYLLVAQQRSESSITCEHRIEAGSTRRTALANASRSATARSWTSTRSTRARSSCPAIEVPNYRFGASATSTTAAA